MKSSDVNDVCPCTRDELIEKFKEISELGWIKNRRPGNAGGVGNTLEDFLGIQENNLPMPNHNEWELKAHRSNSTALTTLFHVEPSPTALKLVSYLLLPKYGWPHKDAGTKYPENEMSFRQTLNGSNYTDRGFKVEVDRTEKKVMISFNSSKVDSRHAEWLKSVKRRAGLGELSPQPYWGFKDLEHSAGVKLLNCAYVEAERKKIGGEEYFWYNKFQMLSNFDFKKFLVALENGNALVDFDARTGHNHGTKFRLRQNYLPNLYKNVETVVNLNPKNPPEACVSEKNPEYITKKYGKISKK